jgi:hypothetical protein
MLPYATALSPQYLFGSIGEDRLRGPEDGITRHHDCFLSAASLFYHEVVGEVRFSHGLA